MIKLSDRLNTIYEILIQNNIDKNDIVADVCSDHGYIPIKLILDNITNKTIATDISKNSIDKIKNNIDLYFDKKDKNKIDIRVGDGLKILNYNDFDILIISGIGYDLMKNILKNIDKYNFKYLIVSPQTKIYDFRKYVLNNNLYIDNEKIVYEDNKYYFILKIIKNNDNKLIHWNEEELLYGKHLLQNKNEILYKYILLKINTYKNNILKINKNKDIINNNDKNIKIIEKYNDFIKISENIINKW